MGAGSGTWLGALFEPLATQAVRVYAAAAGARVGHLRTRGGEHEVDLIVEHGEHSVVAVEVKLGPAPSDRDARQLNWLAQGLGSRLIDRVIINTRMFAYRRPDGVTVVPLALPGP